MVQLLDLTEYCIKCVLCMYLCNGMTAYKDKYTKQGKYIFFLLFVIWKFWCDNSLWLAKLLYGDNMLPERSGMSIIKLILNIAVYFALIDFFYAGSRLLKAYLTLLYAAIIELSRFGLHGLWSLITGAFYNSMINSLLADDVPFETLENFNRFLEISQYVWQFVFSFICIVIAWLTIYFIRKFISGIREINRQGILFLMISPAVGMAFSLALRCIFYTMEGERIEYIYDNHRGMYAIIPLMTFLCLISIVYSIRIYNELIRVQEEKNGMFFYKQQLSDMTMHVRDMERLYDGIRGMRHDMNNYIADMEQLLNASVKQGELNGTVESEAEKYLNRMKDTMESITVKYATGNPVTDVILNRKYQECEKEGFVLESDFIYPDKLGVEAFDMGILLNNALDNAIEGCRKYHDDKTACIRVHSYRKNSMFFIRIENDCDGESLIYTQENTLHTTKDDDFLHGIGLKNMQSVTNRYYGTMSYEVRGDVFYLTIMLQEKKS